MHSTFSSTRNTENNLLTNTPRNISNSTDCFCAQKHEDHCFCSNESFGVVKSCKFFILISGPTGVGKTDLVEKLIKKINFKAEIVNADLGQFYKPLNIGTAKPTLTEQIVVHHLFDIIDQPINFTVLDYRKSLIKCMTDLWKKNIVPIVVGGSSFYIKSIFFPPKEYIEHQVEFEKKKEFDNLSTKELYEKLVEIDPERAKEIYPNDRYRIERALEFWYTTGQKSSQFKPEFESPGTCIYLYLNRDKGDLNQRIISRTSQMIDQGWIKEIKDLPQDWKKFLLKKKIIGYPEILNYIEENKNQPSKEILIKQIAQKTKAYAKRQLTFWKSLCKLLNKVDPKGCFIKEIIEINLSLLDLDLYIRQLSKKLDGLIKCK